MQKEEVKVTTEFHSVLSAPCHYPCGLEACLLPVNVFTQTKTKCDNRVRKVTSSGPHMLLNAAHS